ncbi:MAG: AAA family ATPase [Gammaproteobacteria bacterium]
MNKVSDFSTILPHWLVCRVSAEFPQRDLLDTMVAERRLQARHIDSMAETIANFHSGAPGIGPDNRLGAVGIIEKWSRENFPPNKNRSAFRAAYRYMDLAHSWAHSTRGAVIIMHGLSGSGKSSLARQLAGRLGAIQLRSDIERKRLFDLKPGDDSGSPLGRGIYTEDAGTQTYDRLSELTKTIVEAGFTAIVDASFLNRSRRKQFLQLARDCRVPYMVLSCDTPEDLLRVRIQQRRAKSQDASEANLAVLQHQLESQEPVNDEERAETFVVTCEESGLSQQQLNRIIQHLTA